MDLDAGMLAVARQKHPDVRFHQADMVDFELIRRFDLIVCLSSSIGYAKTASRLQQTLQNMSRHLHPRGLVTIEPWFTPETYKVGGVHALFVDQPGLKIARMNISELEDGVSVLNFHYLVATPNGIKHFTERHEVGLFSHDDYVAAFQAVGCKSCTIRKVRRDGGCTLGYDRSRSAMRQRGHCADDQRHTIR